MFFGCDKLQFINFNNAIFTNNNINGLFLSIQSNISICLNDYSNLNFDNKTIEKIKIGKWMKIFVIIFVILCTIGIYTALYIVWTPQIAGKIGSNEITGVQGRYFLPLIMPLLLLLCNIRIRDNKFFKIVRDNYLLIPIISLVVSLCMVFMRFW